MHNQGGYSSLTGLFTVFNCLQNIYPTITLPEVATREIMTHNSLPCNFSLQSTTLQTIVQILHHFTVTVNNTEVTVNTCTCTNVFTIITTKDQSGGLYNN